ncbi:MAG: DNA mismatch repair endonuclease MutL [Firmicutes bacterium]|nr:DNA mismatch repair endonuclease MutL [Bacillota bacterium]
MRNTQRHIFQLPQVLADRIAAGEVVDRPVSIVKELVENSIDAGATSIVVEIRNGGKTYLRVTDNGCGIASEEAELAFSRHATSKIHQLSDLDAIETLGFRGEALASIAAVSRTELVTKTEEERTGTYLLIEGGRIADHSEKGAPVGTTLVVRDLFYNTPARLKFLKNDNVESARIIDLVSRIAIAYTGIRFRFINNGNTLFSTPGKGDRRTAIATVFDPHLAKKLIRTDAQGPDGLVLEAYISPPDLTRPNRKNQIFFVNGRNISSRILEEAVSEAYRARMFEGRFPVAFLFLKADPAFTDVNIHPNKREIRFDNEKLVKEFVTAALQQALTIPEAVPSIRIRETEKPAPEERPAETAPRPEPFAFEKQEQMDIRGILRRRRAEEEKIPEPAGDIIAAEEERVHYDYAPSQQESVPHPFEIDELEPIGILFNEYILCSGGDAFYMIDQHAAHERVFYEQFVDSFYSGETAGQVLLEPLTLTAGFSAGSQAEDWLGFLRAGGFRIEEFGPRTYIVREIPAYMDLKEAEDFLADFTEEAEKAGSFRDQRRIDRIITKACKSAVKANDRLSSAEVRHLLGDLAACRNPFSCPHGRPTVIRMTHAEIDRLFKR